MAMHSLHASSNVGASSNACHRESNDARSTEIATVPKKYVVDAEAAENSKRGRAPMTTTTAAELTGPAVSAIEMRRFTSNERSQS